MELYNGPDHRHAPPSLAAADIAWLNPPLTPKMFGDFFGLCREFPAEEWKHDIGLPTGEGQLMIIRCFAVILVAAALASSAWAQFPDKSVRLIVPFPPGGPLDIVARLVARGLQDQWGQSVIVDNRAGASGVIGTTQLAKSAPDGYTILINSTPIVATPHLQKVPYDPKDIIGLSQLAAIEYIMVAAPSSGIDSVKELIDLAKKEPGKLNYASAGNGSGQHLLIELIKGTTGIRINHVPYKGAAPALQAVLAGEVAVMFETSVSVIPQVRAGKLRPILVTGSKPLEALPDVPPFESIFPGVGIDAWHGIFAPAGIPAPVIQKLAGDIRTAVLSPQVASRLRELGLQPTGLPYPQFNEVVARDFERWGKVIRDNKIKAD